jgi:hypothetical protein
MVVCTHGDVADFCRKYNMKVLETYEGDLSDYRGSCPVLVTNERMNRETYDSLKCDLFSRGVDLVSTHWLDDDVILRLIRRQLDQRGKRGGRQMFGFYKKNGVIAEIPEKMAIARRIIALRDSGKTLREIKERVDLSMSTIQVILKNREVYEK